MKIKTFRAFSQAPTEPRLTTKSFSAIPFADATSQTFETLSDLLDDYYRDKAERDRVNNRLVNWSARSKTILKRTEKISQTRSGVSGDRQCGRIPPKGELLTTFLHQVPNDQDQVVLDNYYTNEPITIQLNKALTPNQNAQRYFKRYQKLKKPSNIWPSSFKKPKETISYLETVETALSQASLAEVAEIREELIQTGFIKRPTAKKFINGKTTEIPGWWWKRPSF